MIILRSEQIRREEERGFQSGISYEQMMRTAGVGAADAIANRFPTASSFAVVCGKGKNGGDGFVAAMRFLQIGKRVQIILAMGEPRDLLALRMYREALRSGIAVSDFEQNRQQCLVALNEADVLVDAVFGIGFSGVLREPLCEIAESYNCAPGFKAALDLPSGLNADFPKVPALYFYADYTVTMHALKPVHCLSPAREACGAAEVVPIGFDLSDLSDDTVMTESEFADIAKKFTPREPNTHKGSFGYALSICGSYAMPGAAVLAAQAAVQSGVGLLAAAFPNAAYTALSSKLTEQIYVPCPSDPDGCFSAESAEVLMPHINKASAVLFGCGAGTADGCAVLLKRLLQTVNCPLILDADGINLAAMNIDVLRESKAPVLLTPHPGEMARLVGKSIRDINENRAEIALEFAKKNGVTVLLKGRQTLIATPDGRIFVNPTGNPGMATGGSGDLLSGLILSFAAQGMNLADAAVSAAFIHGAAGDLAAERYSMMGTTPLRMLEMLPSVLSQIEKAM